MYVFSVQIYIYTTFRRRRREIKKTFQKIKKNIEDGYELYIFHEMSKCDIGYIKTNKNTSETRKRETFLISRKLNKLENIFRYLL